MNNLLSITSDASNQLKKILNTNEEDFIKLIKKVTHT